MGNLCSKSANKSDSFSQPGRVLGNAPPSGGKSSTTVPSGVSTTSPGRTLGGGQDPTTQGDPRSAAAKAAEERATKANKPGGKLQDQLAAQRKQTQNQLLQASSDQERGARIADANTEARNWN